MNTEEILKKYGKNKNHSNLVSNLAALFFEKILPFFPYLQKYNNKKDLNLLKIGARLHDIGIYFEDVYNVAHHKAGAKFILNNPPDEIDEKDLIVLCCLIRYHRKSLPDDTHKLYNSLDNEEKEKVQHLGSIIRLVDSFDYSHINMIENFDVEYNYDLNVLTLKFRENIMLNGSLIKAIQRKKDFFESAYKVQIELK